MTKASAGARHDSGRFVGIQVYRGNPKVLVTPGRAATARKRFLRYFITFACYGARLTATNRARWIGATIWLAGREAAVEAPGSPSG